MFSAEQQHPAMNGKPMMIAISINQAGQPDIYISPMIDPKALLALLLNCTREIFMRFNFEMPRVVGADGNVPALVPPLPEVESNGASS